MMNASRLHVIPLSLREGHKYLLLEKDQPAAQGSHPTVIFVSYTACPAIVVVKNSDGLRRRCPRECLKEVQVTAHYVQQRP